jgi:hypothetical protein
MEPESSLTSSQEPSTGPYTEPHKSSSYRPHPISLRSLLMLSSRLCLGLLGDLIPLASPTEFYIHSSTTVPCIRHALPILSSLTSSF